MARYYFHNRDHLEMTVSDSVDLRNAAEARQEAFRTASQMVSESGVSGRMNEVWFLSVADEDGVTVCDLSFTAKCATREPGMR